MKTSLLAMVFFTLVTSCSKDDVPTTEEANYAIDLNLAQETDWVFADQVLDLVNQHRTSIGLETLKRDRQYASAYSVEHTKYMINKEKISHDNFGVRSKALKNRGAETVGENVAYGYTNAEELVNAWLNSPSHRNIIEGPYNYSGFGILKNNKGQYYFTQLFYRK